MLTSYVNVSRQKWHILTFFRKNGIVGALLEPCEEPVELRSAAVEHVAAPVEPVLAPVDKGSSP